MLIIVIEAHAADWLLLVADTSAKDLRNQWRLFTNPSYLVVVIGVMSEFEHISAISLGINSKNDRLNL